MKIARIVFTMLMTVAIWLTVAQIEYNEWEKNSHYVPMLERYEK
jgi:hypothetical protein